MKCTYKKVEFIKTLPKLQNIKCQWMCVICAVGLLEVQTHKKADARWMAERGQGHVQT